MTRSETTGKPTHKPQETFTGPLFIIGMPRSGTKLLRELLNLHPGICIASIETEFLPYWVRNWSTFGDLSDRAAFSRFYKAVIEYPYFTYMHERAKVIEEETWYRLCKEFTPAGVFEALIRHDVGADDGSDLIWGDKSPSYITHMPLLKRIFAGAKFIHIIRDVRDYCLSMKKSFGKHMLRAAQLWTQNVAQAKRDALQFPEAYLEIYYEKLLEDPEKELRRCCAFLGVEFDPKMVQLDRDIENRGDAKGQQGIKQDNTEKYKKLMSPKLRRKIEAIALPTLQMCGYPVEYSGKPVKVSPLQMLFYQLLDGINLIRLDVDQRGLVGSLKFYTRYFITSGNRKANRS